MSALSEFFLGSSAAIRQLDLLEITHPGFTQDYRIVRNARAVTVTHEGPDGPYDYTYFPMTIRPVGSSNDLSQSMAVTLGDLGELIATEIGAVMEANSMGIRPTVKFRTYRSDDLSAPIFGPLTLEIKNVTCSEEGSTFECVAPLLNVSKTGNIYTRDQFPMLRGFF